MLSHYFVETSDFDSFARYVCALRENSLRVYSHRLNGKNVLSSRRILSNSLLSFYTNAPNSGRYISYNAKGGKEDVSVVSSISAFSKYSPIINLNSLPKKFVINPKKIKDKFNPISIEDLGSLARLTYDPELSDEPDLTLFLFPLKRKWVIGHITKIDFNDTIYFFNYVTLDEDPSKPFLQYSTTDDKIPVFTDRFQHGLFYLPVIKLKKSHLIFGLE